MFTLAAWVLVAGLAVTLARMRAKVRHQRLDTLWTARRCGYPLSRRVRSPDNGAAGQGDRVMGVVSPTRKPKEIGTGIGARRDAIAACGRQGGGPGRAPGSFRDCSCSPRSERARATVPNRKLPAVTVMRLRVEVWAGVPPNHRNRREAFGCR